MDSRTVWHGLVGGYWGGGALCPRYLVANLEGFSALGSGSVGQQGLVRGSAHRQHRWHS